MRGGRVMEVLGEAVKRLPPEMTAQYPAVDWRDIAGMRDLKRCLLT
jgi:uncharacterized protein with HEPN domain